MPIIDQTDDRNGQKLYSIINNATELPEFVKSASSEDIYGPDEGLPNHVFADPMRRKFPCHTPAATWISASFYKESKDQLPKKLSGWIVDRLKSAAQKFNIQTLIDSVLATTKTEKKASLHDDDYAVVIRYTDGSKERYYPLTTRQEVKEAAEYLHKYRDEMPFPERQAMAEKILAKSAHFGASLGGLDDFIEKQAGMGTCAGIDAANLIWNRVKMLGRMDRPSDLQIKLAEIAKSCADQSRTSRTHDPYMLRKLAEIIDTVDHSHGLYRDYGESVPRPEDVLFAVTEKVATQILTEFVSLQNGSVYKTADFHKLQLKDVRGLFGDGFADAISSDGMSVSPVKLAELARTLPRPDAELIDRLLQDSGIAQMTKDAAQHTAGLTNEDWKQLGELCEKADG